MKEKIENVISSTCDRIVDINEAQREMGGRIDGHLPDTINALSTLIDAYIKYKVFEDDNDPDDL